MEYTTLENLKEYLWIETTDNSKDALLWRLIKTVTKQFDKYLGFSLWENTYKQYLSSYGEFIVVDYLPVGKIITMKESNPTGASLSKDRIDEWIIYLSRYFEWTVYIEYKAWYTRLDDIADVEQACLEICTLTYNDNPNSGAETNVKSKKIETLSKTFFSKWEMQWWIQMNFREVLDNYKPNIYNPLRI